MPEGHKCRRPHGHTYTVEIVLRGQVPPELGYLIDYGCIATAWEHLHDLLDHHNLNDVPGLQIPTTENLVSWIIAGLKEARAGGVYTAVWELLERVRVCESSTTWCEMTKVEWLAFCGPNA
jgi:6-pyruvoyl-tetrahydropterin synthase